MHITDKTFIVTGGASGLGRAAAEAILAGGGNAVLLDVNAETGQAAEAALGAHARFAQADVTSEEQVKAAIDLAIAAFGRLDGVINAAGIGPAAKVLGKNGPHALDLFEKTIRINLVGTFNVIRLAAAAMAQNAPLETGERGVIINTASIAAFDGQIGQPAYAASKGGIVGLTLPVAREFAAIGIRCVTIAPGIFDTPLLAALAGGGARVARTAGAVPVAPRTAGGVRRACPAHHRERDAERRGDPHGRSAANGAALDTTTTSATTRAGRQRDSRSRAAVSNASVAPVKPTALREVGLPPPFPPNCATSALSIAPASTAASA
jgi:NAD(P)-dependent dehydrogenase (short-subunit alcohol dehydrogenase family)